MLLIKDKRFYNFIEIVSEVDNIEKIKFIDSNSISVIYVFN